ncbi:MAG: glycosyltransferase family 4 protein [Candidatus Omnitrophota bacterium]
MISKQIKVLHIITQLDLGGAQRNALDIVRHLDKQTYLVYLLSSLKGPLIKEALDIPGVKTILLPSLRRPLHPFADIISLIRLVSIFKNEKIDIVHTHSSKAGILGRWAARYAGVPVIIHTIHGWSFHQRQHFLIRNFYTFLERITARITDSLIAVSASDIRKGLTNKIASKDKYTLIRYAIDRAAFFNCSVDRLRKKEELGFEKESPLIGMVACLKPQKSPQDFVKAAALVIEKNPQARFLLVGEGVLRNDVQRLIARLGIAEQVILGGWRRDIPEIMSCLDILALTSLWEGTPLVFLEAMCSKLPVIAYNVDGVSEMIQDGVNGYLVPLGETHTVASRINHLLENKSIRTKMGAEGFALVSRECCAIERMMQEVEHLYRSITAKKSKTG